MHVPFRIKPKLLLLLTVGLLCIESSFAATYTTCTKLSATTIDAGQSKLIPITDADGNPCADCGTMQVTKSDWGTNEAWKCSKGITADTCQPSEYEGCLVIAANSLGTDPQDGTNLGFDTTFACENQATRSCAVNSTDENGVWTPVPEAAPVPFSQCQLVADTPRSCLHLIDGTTYCDDYSEKYACYGSEGPALCNTNPLCSLTSVSCSDVEPSATGLCSTQNQTYSCAKTQTSCVEYASSNPNACPISLESNLPTTKVAKDHKFGEAQAQIEKTTQMAKGLESANSFGELKLFGGSKNQCNYYPGILSSSGLLPNCCNINLDEPKGSLFDKCFPNEFQLQAAKNGKRVVQTDTYCKKRANFPKICIEREQVYCQFSSLFSRIVQQQGRLQLDAYLLNQSAAGTQSSSMVYPFYATLEKGQWTSPLVVNGNAVAGWTWPSYCKDTARYRQLAETQDYILGSCPEEKPVTYLATCAKGLGGCGDLPVSPYDSATGALLSTSALSNWTIAPVDASATIHESISGTVAVKGTCESTSGNCNLDVVAWPGGVGGVSKFAVPVNWMYTSPVEMASDTQWSSEPSLAPGLVVDTGFTWVRQADAVFDDLIIRPYALDEATEGEKPTFTLLQYSMDRGASWTAAHVPLSVDAGSLYLQADTPKFGTLDIYGRCDVQARNCTYTVLAAAPVLAKPWGTRAPDCSGFTMTQLAVLNFGAMDFSEWIAAMGITASNKVDQILSDAVQAQTGVSTIAQRVDDNVTQNTAKRDITVASADPGVCSPKSCSLRITATGVWPESIGSNPGTDGVTSVQVFNGNDSILVLDAVTDANGNTIKYQGTASLPDLNDGDKPVLTVAITTLDGVVHRTTAVLPVSKTAADASRLNFIFTKYTTAPMGQTADGVTFKQLKDDGVVAP